SGCNVQHTWNSGDGARVGFFVAANSCSGPSGTAAKVPAAFATSERFCGAAVMGGGCAAGSVCMPKASSLCALADGDVACPSGFTALQGTSWYSGFNDTRACAACSCAAPTVS